MAGIGFIFAASTLWALDTLIRYPLLWGGTPAAHIVFVEHLILVVLVAVWLSRSKNLQISKLKASWREFLVIGGLGSALGTLAFTQAFSYLNPTVVILLQKLQPLVAITLAAVILKEPIKKSFFIWVLLALSGSLMLMAPDLASIKEISFAAYQGGNSTVLGYGLALFAVVAWGASTVFGKRLSNRGLEEQEIMFGRFSAGLLFLIPCLWLTAEPLSNMTALTMGKILAMVLLSGLVGMYLYYLGLKRVPARIGALAELFFPVAAVTINWLLLDKTLEPMQILGGVVLILASIGAQYQRSQSLPAQPLAA